MFLDFYRVKILFDRSNINDLSNKRGSQLFKSIDIYKKKEEKREEILNYSKKLFAAK